MKITSTALARACRILLTLYPVSTLLCFYLISDENYRIMAALFAANAAAASLAMLIFGWYESSDNVPGPSRLFTLVIAVGSGLTSAVFAIAAEVEQPWLRIGLIAPVVVILLVLIWFVNKVSKERAEHSKAAGDKALQEKEDTQ